MARLVLRSVGTVVHVEGDLESQYRATGWEDVESAEAETPKRGPGRPKKK